MYSKRVVVLKNTFDSIANTVRDDGVEYWLARRVNSQYKRIACDETAVLPKVDE